MSCPREETSALSLLIDIQAHFHILLLLLALFPVKVNFSYKNQASSALFHEGDMRFSLFIIKGR